MTAINIKRRNIRTDLAIEAREMLMGEVQEEIPGVQTQTEDIGEMTVTRVHITTPDAEEKMGKKQGRYITLEAPGLRQKNTELQDTVSRQFTQELLSMLDLGPEQTVLVVGLGNWNVTPDALGPRVVKDLLVTRHILELQPETLGEGFRPVGAIAPGVLGITGVETSEIIQGLVEKVKPDALIAVDALAARNLSRLHTTVQIADTGITPGSGVGNKRMGISQETIGIPVIAVGIPTVVDAVTIADDLTDHMMEAIMHEAGKDSPIYPVIQSIAEGDKRAVMQEVLEPYGGRLMVTPKEIDTLVEDIARLLAGGINAAMHPAIRSEETGKYLH
ncbi:GPR endopeptidase [Dethiobacter alkaliphilus]|uniref:GPR endopeptidase n=1 Tax=Dethiobacter alkaliphilus TaxID=427926 RepID=UPI0022273CE6|nr:GPR endopeptidase [Dethiobacter alkaliphilus]MCW3489312.1 GPR endopeptidase [Dethiobacter alkaliphilus]